jgi:Mce-associated membrane protein
VTDESNETENLEEPPVGGDEAESSDAVRDEAGDGAAEDGTASGEDVDASLTLNASKVVPRLLAVVGVVAVLALVAAGVLAWMHHRHNEDESNARAASQVAATSLQTLLSFTPANVLKDADSESKLMTGSLEKTYTKQLKTDWGPAAVKNGISTKAAVVKVARASVAGDTVKLVVYANLTRSVAGTSQTDIITSTMLITMTKVDGSWRISAYKGV